MEFKLTSKYEPTGDQPEAIRELTDGIRQGDRAQVLLGVTGSGKTFAYLLPLVAMIDATRQEVQAVVVVPGRELALQSQQVLESMRTGLRSMAVYGGRPTMEEHRKMREVRPQVVLPQPDSPTMPRVSPL